MQKRKVVKNFLRMYQSIFVSIAERSKDKKPIPDYCSIKFKILLKPFPVGREVNV